MPAAADRREIERRQVQKLNRMLQAIASGNAFYRRKLAGRGFSGIESLEAFKEFPFTEKEELIRDQVSHPPYGSILTYPMDRYIRVHQTSGTTGSPMYWLDTEESWEWWANCWKVVLEAAGVLRSDRLFFAFSFGPFIGFWTGWEGARKVGALAIPGGGQSTLQRLRTIVSSQATVLVSTPTYALHMAAEAAAAGIDLPNSKVRITVHAGEPGASIPSTKKQIEASWGARCFDHAGATEVGAYGFECPSHPCGLHVNEEEFIVEVIDPATGREVAGGERGEMVITNLGRLGSPVVRYRTGDLVQPIYDPCPCGRPFMILEGGVLGRVDDMVVVRGVNVYPSAVEGILREFSEVEEFRVEVLEREGLSELKIMIEPKTTVGRVSDLERQVRGRIRQGLGLRVQVESVGRGCLPRFELKARRFIKRRAEDEAGRSPS